MALGKHLMLIFPDVLLDLIFLMNLASFMNKGTIISID